MNKSIFNEKGQRVFASILLASFVSIIFAADIPLAIEGFQHASEIAREARELKITSAESLITASEGGMVQLRGAWVKIPAGALKEDTVIRIERLDEVAPTDDIENATIGGGGYRFLPKGTKFLSNIEVGIPCYDFSGNARTYFYDTEKGEWVPLEKVSNSNGTLVSLTTHFTDMIAGSLSMPETPDKPQVNLNTIKSLKAAISTTNAGKVEAQVQGNTGDGSWSLGIEGIGINASFDYSTAQGVGEMGRGFSFNAGQACVTIDTRKRAPKWDGEDVFLIEGVRVHQKSGNVYEPERETEKKIYEYRDNAWHVYDGHGSENIYGKLTVGETTYGAINGKDESHIFEWHLACTRDGYGNGTYYVYDKSEGHVYLDTVEYAKGSRNIKLTYEGREDVRSSGRGTYLDFTSQRLRFVRVYGDVKGENRCIRAYAVNYRKEGRGLRESVVDSIDELDPSSPIDSPAKYRRYAFQYNEYEKNADGTDKVFEAPKEWKTNLTSLGHSVSKSSGVNSSFSGGAGVGTGFIDARATKGRSGGKSTNISKTKEMLIDINGDGLCDIVYSGKDRNYVRIYDKEDREYSVDVPLNGLLNIEFNRNIEETDSSGKSFYGGAGNKSPSIGAGYTRTYNESNSQGETEGTFIDINADGLVDYATQNFYYINCSVDKVINFSGPFTYRTLKGENISLQTRNVAFDGNDPKYLEYLKIYPEENIFRVWKAPYSGRIKITHTFTNIKGLKPDNRGDVKFSIYKEKEFLNKIIINDKTEDEHIVIQTIDIKKNQRIFFTSDFGYDGRSKSVDHNIKINYTEINYFENNRKYDFDNSWEVYNRYDGNPNTKNYIDYLIQNRCLRSYEMSLEEFKKLNVEEINKIMNLFVYDELHDCVYIDENLKKELENREYSYDANHKFPYDLFIVKGSENLPQQFKKNGYTKYLENIYKENNTKWIKKYSGISLANKPYATFELNKINLITIDGNHVWLEYKDGMFKVCGIPDSDLWTATEIGPYLDINVEKTIKLSRDGYPDYIFNFIESNKNSNPVKISKDGMDFIIEKNRERKFDFFNGNSNEPDQIINYVKSVNSSNYDEIIQLVYDVYYENKYNEEINDYELIPRDKVDDKKLLELKNKLKDLTKLQYRLFNIDPYFIEDGDIFNLRKGISQEKLNELNNLKNLIHLINYSSVDVIAVFEEKNYPLINDRVKQLKIEEYPNEEIIIEEWNSEDDFSDSDIQKYISLNGVNIYSQEFFYGGYRGWYYGVWHGNPEAFDIEEIERVFKSGDEEFSKYNLSGYDSDDIKKSGNVKANEDREKYKDEDPVNADIDDECYATVNQNLFPKGENLNKSVILNIQGYDDDTSKRALLGTYSLNQDGSKYGGSYVLKNTIHCQRVGNDLFYSVAGIRAMTQDIGVSATVPISKTRSQGSEKNKGCNGNVAGISGGGTIGSSKSDCCIEEMFTDANGDGIPDVLIHNGYASFLYEGNIINKDGISIYALSNNPYPLNNVTCFSENCTTLSTEGASLSSSKGIEIKHTGNGKVFGILIRPGNLTGSVSVGGSISKASGNTEELVSMNDINGDGIVDYINKGNVFFGVTDGYASSGFAGFPENTSKSENVSNSYSASVDIGAVPVDKSVLENIKNDTGLNGSNLTCGVNLDVGMSFSISENITKSQLLDVNGDGLPDYVESYKSGESNYFKIKYNLGKSFSDDNLIMIENLNTVNKNQSIPSKFESQKSGDLIGSRMEFDDSNENEIKTILSEIDSGLYSLGYSTSTTACGNGSISGNACISIPIPIPFVPLTLNITMNGSTGESSSTGVSNVEVKMTDIDGDGYVDHVTYIDNLIVYRKNLSAKVGLLSKVILPEGGAVTFKYESIGNTVDMPQLKQVVSEIAWWTDASIEESKANTKRSMDCYRTFYSYSDGYWSREYKEFFGFGSVTQSNEEDSSRSETSYFNRSYHSKGMVESQKAFGGTDGTLLMAETKNTLMKGTSVRALVTGTSTTEYDHSRNFITVNENFTYDKYGNITEYEKSSPESNMSLKGEYGYYDKYINGDMHLMHLMSSVEIRSQVTGKSARLERKVSAKYNGKAQTTEYSSYWDEGSRLVTKYDYDGSNGNLIKVDNPDGTCVKYAYEEKYNLLVNGITPVSDDGVEQSGTSVDYDLALMAPQEQRDALGNGLRYKYDQFGRTIEVYTDYDKEDDPAVRNEFVCNSEDGTCSNFAKTYNKVSHNRTERQGNTIITVTEVDGLSRVKLVAKQSEGGWLVSGITWYDKKQRAVKTDDVRKVTDYKNIDTNAEMENPTETVYDEMDRVIETILPDGAKTETSYFIEGKEKVVLQKNPEVVSENKRMRLIGKNRSDAFGRIVGTEKYDIDMKLLAGSSFKYNGMGAMTEAVEGVPEGSEATAGKVTVEYDLLGRRRSIESTDGGKKSFYYNSKGQVDYVQDANLLKNGQKIGYRYDSLGRISEITYQDMANTSYEYNDNGQVTKRTDSSGTYEYTYGKLGEVIEENIELVQQSGTELSDHRRSVRMKYLSNYLGQMDEITYPKGEVVKYEYDKGGLVKSVTGKNPYSADGEDFVYAKDITYDRKERRTSITYGNGVCSEYTYDEQRGWLKKLVTYDKNGEKIQNLEYKFDAVGNVEGYTNSCDGFTTGQRYGYDTLGQLVSVNGESTSHRYGKSAGTEYFTSYSQSWSFGPTGNILSKKSSQVTDRLISIGGDGLEYDLSYKYVPGKAHQVESCGGRWYQYDENGNVVAEQNVKPGSDNLVYNPTVENMGENVYTVDVSWGYSFADERAATQGVYRRTFKYNSRNQMIESSEPSITATYIYGEDGRRTSKNSRLGETMYFNDYATWHITPGDSQNSDGRDGMHIYISGQLVCTKQNDAKSPSYSEERGKSWWYHTNHIGNVDVLTKGEGKTYERFEYTPYGEIWIHHGSSWFTNLDSSKDDVKYRFTGKERDEETGFTYFGARYLDSKRGVWTQVDPALGDYMPGAGADTSKLPGMGGAYNHINFHLYHYAGNNPVMYVDPDGRETYDLSDEQWKSVSKNVTNLIENLSELRSRISDFSLDGDEEIFDAAKEYLGRDFSCAEDFIYLKAQITSVINVLSKMKRNNFKYDDFDRNQKKSGTFAWTIFKFGKTMYLGDNFFNAIDNQGNDTKEGILLHEATHMCGFAIDVPPYPYGVRNARNRLLKNWNSDNYEYFYEKIFSGGL